MNYNSSYQQKKSTKYHFVTDHRPTEEEHSDEISFFYQVATFPDGRTNKYHMRKFVLNSKNEFVAVNEYWLNRHQCRKFFSTKKPHEYKAYPVYNLKDINYPHMADIATSKSSILSNDYDYSGFAPFI